MFVFFIFNNTAMVAVNLWPIADVVEIRLFLLIIFVFVVGMLFSMFLNLIKSVFNIKEIYRVKNLEKELNNLKIDYEKNKKDNQKQLSE